jgi:hypothetical protein
MCEVLFAFAVEEEHVAGTLVDTSGSNWRLSPSGVTSFSAAPPSLISSSFVLFRLGASLVFLDLRFGPF